MPAIYPAFERGLPDCDTVSFNGRALSFALRELDEVSIQLGTTPISTLIDEATMLADIGIEAPDGVDLPEVKWYTAEEGLSAVSPLLAHLDNAEPEFTERQAVIADLVLLKTFLEIAAPLNIGFHLLVDI